MKTSPVAWTSCSGGLGISKLKLKEKNCYKFCKLNKNFGVIKCTKEYFSNLRMHVRKKCFILVNNFFSKHS
jgi:hypothetical protein